jgi:hypothetical protein
MSFKTVYWNLRCRGYQLQTFWLTRCQSSYQPDVYWLLLISTRLTRVTEFQVCNSGWNGCLSLKIFIASLGELIRFATVISLQVFNLLNLNNLLNWILRFDILSVHNLIIVKQQMFNFFEPFDSAILDFQVS